jgi:hypothetical protein
MRGLPFPTSLPPPPPLPSRLNPQHCGTDPAESNERLASIHTSVQQLIAEEMPGILEAAEEFVEGGHVTEVGPRGHVHVNAQGSQSYTQAWGPPHQARGPKQ